MQVRQTPPQGSGFVTDSLSSNSLTDFSVGARAAKALIRAASGPVSEADTQYSPHNPRLANEFVQVKGAIFNPAAAELYISFLDRLKPSDDKLLASKLFRECLSSISSLPTPSINHFGREYFGEAGSVDWGATPTILPSEDRYTLLTERILTELRIILEKQLDGFQFCQAVAKFVSTGPSLPALEMFLALVQGNLKAGLPIPDPEQPAFGRRLSFIAHSSVAVQVRENLNAQFSRGIASEQLESSLQNALTQIAHLEVLNNPSNNSVVELATQVGFPIQNLKDRAGEFINPMIANSQSLVIDAANGFSAFTFFVRRLPGGDAPFAVRMGEALGKVAHVGSMHTDTYPGRGIVLSSFDPAKIFVGASYDPNWMTPYAKAWPALEADLPHFKNAAFYFLRAFIAIHCDDHGQGRYSLNGEPMTLLIFNSHLGNPELVYSRLVPRSQFEELVTGKLIPSQDYVGRSKDRDLSSTIPNIDALTAIKNGFALDDPRHLFTGLEYLKALDQMTGDFHQGVTNLRRATGEWDALARTGFHHSADGQRRGRELASERRRLAQLLASLTELDASKPRFTGEEPGPYAVARALFNQFRILLQVHSIHSKGQTFPSRRDTAAQPYQRWPSAPVASIESAPSISNSPDSSPQAPTTVTQELSITPADAAMLGNTDWDRQHPEWAHYAAFMAQHEKGDQFEVQHQPSTFSPSPAPPSPPPVSSRTKVTDPQDYENGSHHHPEWSSHAAFLAERGEEFLDLGASRRETTSSSAVESGTEGAGVVRPLFSGQQALFNPRATIMLNEALSWHAGRNRPGMLRGDFPILAIVPSQALSNPGTPRLTLDTFDLTGSLNGSPFSLDSSNSIENEAFWMTMVLPLARGNFTIRFYDRKTFA